MREPDFWQALLSLDLLPKEARDLLRQIPAECRSREDLLSCPALSEEQVEVLSQQRVFSPEEMSRFRVVSLEDEDYPENLRHTSDPPVALFVWGELLERDSLAVAVVGTRQATAYGRSVARKVARDLAQAGLTIVSGGAYGVDSEAHRGALEVGGRTIAVMGSGLDCLYPAAHRGLYEQIAQSGAVVSQFALGCQADRWRFPVRNFTIAGLSRAVVVVEAPVGSGALLTAKSAVEEGRHVFVVPAPIDSETHYGGFELINEGATLLYRVEQVLEVLGVEVGVPKQAVGDLSATQELILGRLSREPEVVDSLSDSLGLPPALVLAELTALEIRGLVMKAAGGYIRL
jgi:DNA processing protein